jgi:hypothetical protein
MGGQIKPQVGFENGPNGNTAKSLVDELLTAV